MKITILGAATIPQKMTLEQLIEYWRTITLNLHQCNDHRFKLLRSQDDRIQHGAPMGEPCWIIHTLEWGMFHTTVTKRIVPPINWYDSWFYVDRPDCPDGMEGVYYDTIHKIEFGLVASPKLDWLRQR